MPRISKIRPTLIYWLFDTRPETLAHWPDGRPFYCGKTILQPNERLSAHRRAACKHPNRPISQRLNQCGEYVRIQIMAISPGHEIWVEQERAWIELEKFWISSLRFLWSGALNISEGGAGASGAVRSAEFRAKVSVAHKGKKRAPFSAETRARMSASHNGKRRAPFSEEHRANLRAASKNRPEEVKTKIGLRYKGKQLSAEHRANVSAGMRGKKRGPYSIEHRTKISEAKRGKPGKKHSAEMRAKLSAATTAHYEALRAAKAT